MTEITLDIESIPSQIEAVRAEINAAAQREIAELTAPKSYTKPETIAEWKANKKTEILAEAAEKYLKLSFDGAANHIVCVGLQINDDEPIAFYGDGDDAIADERKIMVALFDHLEANVRTHEKPTFIGHNIVGFDLKIIKQRAIVLGIRPPALIPFNTKPWDNNPFDTMAQWDQKSFVSLGKICKALGLPGKEGSDGADVYPMWREKRLAEIAAYCLSDVRKTRAVYKRMQFQTVAEESPCQAA